MRRLLVLLALLCLAETVSAGESTWRHQDAEESWLSADHPENSSYFAPKLRASMVNDSLAFWPGVGIGWIVGSVLSVGFEGYFLVNEINASNPDTARFSMAVAGMKFEAIPDPQRRTHMVWSLLIGGGGAQLGGTPDVDSLTNHGFFVMEPGAGLEFNLTKSVRLMPAVSYLWISGTVPGLESKWKASETAFSVTLRFKDPS
ncbi:MAG TPA: hypothetical protein VJ385_19375 [Fibrobacteria bacterium]|nr:hypothetical protein [Fibrobacteria bacterium]